MNDPIRIAIISAGLASLINCIFQLINKLIDNAKERRENDEKKRILYLEKKEKAYIAAIDRLLQVRRGFEYRRENLSDSRKKRIDEENMEFFKISPLLRLYSTDKIFNKYQELATYSRFAYAPLYEPILFESSKRIYDIQITLLARLMQEDLGYRRYNSEPDMIICPNCECEHDMILECPNCGLTFDELQKKLQEKHKPDFSMQNQSEENSENQL